MVNKDLKIFSHILYNILFCVLEIGEFQFVHVFASSFSLSHIIKKKSIQKCILYLTGNIMNLHYIDHPANSV
jgi:hypothetical protein